MEDDDAANNAAATDARFGAIETQLTAFGGQFQTLLTAIQALQAGQQQQPNLQQQVIPPPPPPPAPAPAPPAASDHRRRLDPSNLPKLSADVTLIQLQSWRRSWDPAHRLQVAGRGPGQHHWLHPGQEKCRARPCGLSRVLSKCYGIV